MLAAICRVRRPKTVFEFGTFTGRTAASFAANTPEESVVYTLDIPHDHPKLKEVGQEEKYVLGQETRKLFEGTGYGRKIRQIWADSAEFNEATFQGQMDLVFIDASHSYEYVTNDTMKSLRILKPGGVLLWHDYQFSWPDVVRFLNERAKELGIVRMAGTSNAVAILSDPPRTLSPRPERALNGGGGS